MTLKFYESGTDGAERVVIYGEAGIGKSSFATQFPKPIAYFDVENSLSHIKGIPTVLKPLSYSELWNDLSEIYNNNYNGFKTIVIDTFDVIESHIINDVCDQRRITSLSDQNFGQAYQPVYRTIRELLTLLKKFSEVKNIHVVIVVHSTIKKVELPEQAGQYDTYVMNVLNNTMNLLCEWSTFVFFMKFDTKVVEINKRKKAISGDRMVYCRTSACWKAKSRVDELPDSFPLDYNFIKPIIERNNNTFNNQQKTVNDSFTESKEVEKPIEQQIQKSTLNVDDNLNSQEIQEIPVNVMAAETTAAENHDDQYEGLPIELVNLLKADNISVNAIYEMQKQQGYFSQQMQVKDYPVNYLLGYVVANWQQLKPVLQSIETDLKMDTTNLPF